MFQSEDEDSLIKIIDFGIARSLDSSKKIRKKKGTTLYLAPEVIRENYNEKCDVWSCGILFYLIFMKTFPFNDESIETLENKILESNSYNFLSKLFNQEFVPDGAKHLIKKMLEYDKKKRISMEGAFHHDWIQKFNLIKAVDEKIIQKTLKNLLLLKFERKLQEFIWLFFVNNFATSIYNNKDEVLDAFHSVDLNGDGILSKEEMILAYSKVVGDLKRAEKYVEKIFKYLDCNKNGSIDFSEFVIGALSQENFLTKKKLRIGFQMFDKVKKKGHLISRIFFEFYVCKGKKWAIFIFDN